jgi:hypothetical protein
MREAFVSVVDAVCDRSLTPKIGRGSHQALGIILEKTKTPVASIAQGTPYLARIVVMINLGCGLFIANGTEPVLRDEQVRVRLGRQAKSMLKTGQIGPLAKVCVTLLTPKAAACSLGLFLFVCPTGTPANLICAVPCPPVFIFWRAVDTALGQDAICHMVTSLSW